MQYEDMNEGREQKKDVIEPEVLPPEDGGGRRRGGGVIARIQWPRVISAVLAGLVLDLADLLTRMPLIPHGAVLGALVGWYICRTQRVPVHQRAWWIAATALYCAAPLTEFYPLATLILLYRALRN